MMEVQARVWLLPVVPRLRLLCAPSVMRGPHRMHVGYDPVYPQLCTLLPCRLLQTPNTTHPLS